jgi:nicotinamidase-related amidase
MGWMRHPRLQDRDRTVLVIIDLQESYRQVLSGWDGVEAATLLMVRGAMLLGLPIVVTEQYPLGLGHTSEPVRSALGSSVPIFEKSTLSCCGALSFMEALEQIGRPQVLVAGIEAHACVNQTVLDLIAKGYQVAVARDATSSRHARLVEPAWDGMVQSGMRPTSAEQALLELVESAGSPEFKRLQSLLKADRP